MDIYERLTQTVSHLVEMSPSQKTELHSIFKPAHLALGEHFIEAGQLVDQLAFIGKGVVRFYYMTLDGEDFTKSFRMEGDFITVYGAYLKQQSAQFSIEALTDCELLVASFSDFIQLSEKEIIWLKLRLKLIENLYMIKEQRESDLLLTDATTRYQQFRRDYPGLEERVRQYHIASFLGITPVSLSRIRRQLNRN